MTKQETERIELEIAQIKVVKADTSNVELMKDLDKGIEWLTWVLDSSKDSPFQRYTAWRYKDQLGKEGLINRRNQDRRK